MGKYILKRIVILIPTVIAVTFMVFALMALAPNTPGDIILGAGADPESVAALNHEFGYDLPFFQRYWNWLSELVLKGSFGKSYMTRQPVLDQIIKRTPISMTLAFLGVTGATLIGVTLGVISAVRQNKLSGVIPSVICLILAAFPSFWIGMLLMYQFCYRWRLLDPIGVEDPKGFILPAVAITCIYAAQQMRHTRSAMLETIRQDYVRTARAKGSTEKVAIWKHALGNALLPTITIIGSNFGQLVGGAIVMESLFSIPGLGSFVIDSINNRDIPALLAAVTVLAAIYCTVLLIVDLLYAVADPRVKARYTK